MRAQGFERAARRPWGLAMLLAVVMALAACGGGSDDPPSTVSATLGAAGGTINGPDGVQMVVPAGALAADTTLTIARVTSGAAEGPAGYTATTPVYEFTPHGQLFAQPVTIRMPYTAPAGAEDADVFMASPGEDWEAQQATVNGGMAEWQRLTLSYGAYWACSIPANNTDPYPCTPARLNVTVAATPAQAMTTRPFSNGTAHDLTAETALRFSLFFSAARDCGAASVSVLRAGRSGRLLDQPVSLTPSSTGPRSARGSTTFDLTLGHADNGNVTLGFFFRCTRPDGRRQSASFHHFFNVQAPQPPASAAPAVQTQPLDQSVTAPAPATFSVAATGTPAPTWQWQRSTDGGSSWTNIVGATGPSYTTPATTLADNGLRLRAVATNASGSATTNEALLSVSAAVTAPPPFLGQWPTPVMVESQNNTVGGLIRETRLACSRSGSCIATWARISSNDLLNDGVYAARYTTAQGWGAPLQLSADRGREPQVGVDDDGNAVIVWSARDTANIPQAFVRRYAPASGWGGTSQLSPAGTDRAVAPMAVAMRGSGQVVIAYVRRLDAEAADSLWAARPDGSGWISARVPGAGGVSGDGERLSAALDSQGRATLLWRGAGNAVWAASAAADGTWSSAVDLSGPRLSSRAPRLAIDTDGQAFAVWQEDASTASLHLRRRPAGAGWEPVQTLNFAAGVGVDRVDVAGGPAGSVTVAYVLGEGSIVTRDFTAAGGWSQTSTVVNDGNTIQGDLPRIVMDTGGNVTVLWRGYQGGTFGVYTRSTAPGLGWAPALAAAPVRLATVDQTYRETALAAMGDGRAAMLFLRTNTSFLDELLGAVQTP